MVMRWTVVVLAGLHCSLASAGGLIPGFRGMNWGDPVSKLGEVVPVPEKADCYLRKSEKLSLNDNQLEQVRYCFKRGGLSSVVVASKSSFSAMKAAVEGAYGPTSFTVRGYAKWGDSEERGGGSAALIASKQSAALVLSSNDAALEDKVDKVLEGRKDF